MGFLGSLFGKKKQPAPVAEAAAPAPPEPGRLSDGFHRVPLVRFENVTVQHLLWREVVLDGKRLTDVTGSDDRQKKTTFISMRTGRRFETEEAALAAFEAVTSARNHWSKTSRTTRDLPNSRWPVPPAPSVNPELEARLDAAAPAAFDAEVRVYTDWLLSQGDPRGELAALVQAGTSPDAFLTTNGEALFGQLDVLFGWAITELEWRAGLLHGATLSVRDWEGQRGGLPELTTEFLKLPVARFVRSLRFGLTSFEGENDWSSTLLAAAASERGRFITSIRCDAYESTDSELSWANFGDLSACWRGLPAIETLVIRAGGDGELGQLELPALRNFRFETGGLDAGRLDTILLASWPKLERLELWTGDPGYGATVTGDQFARLLRKPPPALKHLGVVNSELGPQLLPLLVTSPLFAQLTSLDLSMGTLSYDNVELLLSLAPQLNKLAAIDLRQNLFKPDEVVKLKAALPQADLGEQRDWQSRYVAVGE